MDVNQVFGDLNDLWMFDAATVQWKWMGGYTVTSPVCSSGPPGSALPTFCGAIDGSFGTLGVSDPGNIPGGRGNATSWTASDGSLWLYSGAIDNALAAPSDYVDLWRFTPSAEALPPTLRGTGGDIRDGGTGIPEQWNGECPDLLHDRWFDPVGQIQPLLWAHPRGAFRHHQSYRPCCGIP